jgi:hypothetical protein
MFIADNESLIMLRICSVTSKCTGKKRKKQVQVFPWAPSVCGDLWPQLFGDGGPPLSGNASSVGYHGRWNKFLVPPFHGLHARPRVQVNLAITRQGARPRVVTLFFFCPFFVWRQRLIDIVCLVLVLFSVFLPGRCRSLKYWPEEENIVCLLPDPADAVCWNSSLASHDPVIPYVGSLALAGGGSPNHKPERQETNFFANWPFSGFFPQLCP